MRARGVCVRVGTLAIVTTVAVSAATSIVLSGACGGARVGDVGEPSVDAPAVVGDGAGLGVNDVSVLFPAAGEALWPASMPARGGALLPKARFDRIGLSLIRDLADADEYAALRVVSLRADPCFRTALEGACEPQVRLVLQAPTADGKTFHDGAVHALYGLDAARFATFVRGLEALVPLAPENRATPAAASTLGVSPALAAQGMDGPYARGLHALVSEHLGEAALVRMTFMTRTNARAGQWQFGGFDARGDKLIIFGTGATQQNVTRNNLGHVHDYAVHPLFAEPEGHPGASGTALEQADAGARAAVHRWAVAQEDPSQRLADTTDCAACHLAGHVARHLEGLDPGLVTPDLAAARAPRAIGVREQDIDNLRAFGWFADAPHVSQRVANESAAVVARLRQDR